MNAANIIFGVVSISLVGGVSYLMYILNNPSRYHFELPEDVKVQSIDDVLEEIKKNSKSM